MNNIYSVKKSYSTASWDVHEKSVEDNYVLTDEVICHCSDELVAERIRIAMENLEAKVRGSLRALANPTMPDSDFRGTDGKRIKYGNWRPTHYAWIDGPVRNGAYTQWLVVGPTEWVEIGGRQILLEAVPPGCNIKGMVELDRPCVARKQHKLIRGNSEVRLDNPDLGMVINGNGID
jgi:hypothetical protein